MNFEQLSCLTSFFCWGGG